MARQRRFLTLHGTSQDYTHGWATFFRSDGLEMRDVPAADLGHPPLHDPRNLFRAAHTYAVAKGFVGAYPTFVTTGADYSAKHRLACLSEDLAEHGEAPEAELPDLLRQDFCNYFGQFHVHAHNRRPAFVSGFPTGHTRADGDRTLHGTVRIRGFCATQARFFQDEIGDVLGADYAAVARGLQTVAERRGYAFAFHSGWFPNTRESKLVHDFFHLGQVRHLVVEEGWAIEQSTPFAPTVDGAGVVHYAMTVVLTKDV